MTWLVPKMRAVQATGPYTKDHWPFVMAWATQGREQTPMSTYRLKANEPNMNELSPFTDILDMGSSGSMKNRS
jgi:hypothetical protein